MKGVLEALALDLKAPQSEPIAESGDDRSDRKDNGREHLPTEHPCAIPTESHSRRHADPSMDDPAQHRMELVEE